jgi:hypothetical protein
VRVEANPGAAAGAAPEQKEKEAVVRVRNVWFDLPTFFGAAFMLGSAVAAAVDYKRGEHPGPVVVAIAAIIFLLLSLLCLRASLQLGDRQRKARERGRGKGE